MRYAVRVLQEKIDQNKRQITELQQGQEIAIEKFVNTQLVLRQLRDETASMESELKTEYNRLHSASQDRANWNLTDCTSVNVNKPQEANNKITENTPDQQSYYKQ
jgi:cupin superfamily acireductone dioxygenase involved in methionine salvage